MDNPAKSAAPKSWLRASTEYCVMIMEQQVKHVYLERCKIVYVG